MSVALSYKFSRYREYFGKVSFLATQVRWYGNTDASSSRSSIVLDEYEIVCVKSWNHRLLSLP